jgi:hypothetical protein
MKFAAMAMGVAALISSNAVSQDVGKLAAPPQVVENGPASILSKMETAMLHAANLTADIHYRSTTGLKLEQFFEGSFLDQENQDVTWHYKGQPDKGRYYIEGPTGYGGNLCVCDGTTTWVQYDYGRGRITYVAVPMKDTAACKMKIGAVSHVDLENGNPSNVEKYRRELSFDTVTDGRYEGQHVWVLHGRINADYGDKLKKALGSENAEVPEAGEARPTKAQADQWAQARLKRKATVEAMLGGDFFLYVGHDDYLLRGAELKVNNSPVMSVQYSGIRSDLGYDSAAFTYHPPQGAVDATNIPPGTSIDGLFKGKKGK